MHRFLQTITLRSRIILVYVIILGLGGLITSFFGAIITNKTIMSQAEMKVLHDLRTANMVYTEKLKSIKKAMKIGASANMMADALKNGDKTELNKIAHQIAGIVDIDFLSVTDSNGRVKYRMYAGAAIGDDVANVSTVNSALKGNTAAATEIFSAEMLHNENPVLDKQARILLKDEITENDSVSAAALTSGMVLVAASPIYADDGSLSGVLYGGNLLNNDFSIVDQVWKLAYKGEKFNDEEIGAVTLFYGDLLISSNIKSADSARVVGARISPEIFHTVREKKMPLALHSKLLSERYISEFQPICNFSGEVIGMLHVGALEKAYVSMRNAVMGTFMTVAVIGFFLIIFISYLITRTITRPLSEMVDVTNRVAAGDLDYVIKIKSKDEIGQLAYSFNRMIASLKKMRRELEEWGNTLEQKVKHRTEELAAMQRTLMQSQRLASLGKLAAGIAHEINNPLGGILVLSSLVMEDLPDSDPHRENLEEVIKQTMRCRDIVKGLLQFSRQEQGKTEYVNVNEVLNNTLALIEKQALFHNIKVKKNFQEDLPFILGDNSQLQQVFMNVILNAVQAMEEVGDLTLTTFRDKKDDLVVIEITDTGCGIPEDLIDRIFDPFFTTKEVGEGTGLGLAIAYGIITRHNGRMSVKSKVGEGTTFTIKIPVAEKVKVADENE